MHFSRGSSQPRDQTQVSHRICRQILYNLSNQGRFKIYYKITIINKVWYRWKDRQMTQWNRIESLKEVLRHMCLSFITKVALQQAIVFPEKDFQSTVCPFENMTLDPYPTQLSILEALYNYMQKKSNYTSLRLSDNMFVILEQKKFFLEGYKELYGLEQGTGSKLRQEYVKPVY